jgi:hypothetical protein
MTVTSTSKPGLARVAPLCVSGTFDGGGIVTDPEPEALGELVMGGQVVVVSGVLGSYADELLALRRQVFEWGQSTPPQSSPDPTANSHCQQAGVSPRQGTPHVYHSYNLNRISQLPADLRRRLLHFYEPLAAFQNSLTGNSGRLEAFDDEATLRPQLIQYPLGGGLFGRHIHPLEPQRIGMIVALSRRGVDFARGGTCFAPDDSIVDIEPHHDLGDIALFRFDIPHWVNPSDFADNFDWDSEAGRWSMVLPYH